VTDEASAQPRVLEGHFTCGNGLLIEAECLGRAYSTKLASHDLRISLPRLPNDWQGDGLLNPPDWTYRTFRDPEQEAKMSDGNFDWGVAVGFRNNPDGTQSPEFARVRRWRFETTIVTTRNAMDFFAAREKAMEELGVWWSLVSSWISIFTKQDFVEIGKAGSGIRVGPVVKWLGDEAGLRVNGSRDTSIPVVNDEGVDQLDDATLTRCMTLAAKGTQPPLEWLFIRDAYSLVNAKQNRRAAIDACTAAELSLTALIDNKFTADGTAAADRKEQFEKHHGISKLKTLHKNVSAAGVLPKRLVDDVGALRNKAAHRGYDPSPEETTLAIETATLVVELASPLANFT
jgi:hypothetical protein